ncbi:MAG: methylated-DNA--[protein]-cysteine S-methyltransferase, partial [Bryobacterales bacterium]|nr:methylated-DNA--[protein]-cysteine S-methyltransferase [Bryobacterales bacterium]
LFLVWDGLTVRALEFGDHEDRLRDHLQRQYAGVELFPAVAPDQLKGPLEAYFDGNLTAIDQVEVAANGTAFQQQVWKELRRIPAGSTISYGELAHRIGNPEACRAVGLANGANPIGIIVPCHRVIGSSGKLTGYGGGIERKRWLLAHEGVTSRLLVG